MGGELEVGKSPLSELGGDRLKEMEKIHAMEAEEVSYIHVQCHVMPAVSMLSANRHTVQPNVHVK